MLELVMLDAQPDEHTENHRIIHIKEDVTFW